MLQRLSETGRETRLASLVMASWIRNLKLRGEQGELLTFTDEEGARVARAMEGQGSDPRQALAISSVFEKELPANLRFVSEVQEALHSLQEYGIDRALELYIDE